MSEPAGDIRLGDAAEGLGDRLVKKLFRMYLEFAQSGLDFDPISSMGLRSGLYGGKDRTEAPTASIASTTPLTL